MASTRQVVLGIPKDRKYRKDVDQIIRELRKYKIPFETKEIDEPDAIPSLALRPNSLVWDYVGYEEIMAFIENWDYYWKKSFEEEEAFLHHYRKSMSHDEKVALLKAYIQLINKNREQHYEELEKAKRKRWGYE